MSTGNTALAKMVRPRRPTRGASHTMLESMADGLFRGPAKTEHGIDLLVREAVAQGLTQARALAELPSAAVPHVLNHADGRVALLVFDGAMADALIEQQTLGRISQAARVERDVTSIDAALSTGFATSIAKMFDILSQDVGYGATFGGYQCGRPQIDRAALSLALSSKYYNVLRVKLDLGPGLKTGAVQLILPTSETDASDPTKTEPNPEMTAVLQNAPLQLMVQLPKVSLSLKTLIGLAPDAQLRLPKDALKQARLLDQSGATLTKGQVGQLNGVRAIRINGPKQAENVAANPMASGTDMPGSEMTALVPRPELAQTAGSIDADRIEQLESSQSVAQRAPMASDIAKDVSQSKERAIPAEV